MTRPKVSLENYEEVYDFYESHNPSTRIGMLGHLLVGGIIRASVSFAQEGEAEVAIKEDLASGKRMILAPNHLNMLDPILLVAITQRSKSLREFRGNTTAVAKEGLFNMPTMIGGALLRRAIDGFGAVPAFRKKDIRSNVDNELLELQKNARARLAKIQLEKLVKPGGKLMVYPEGTRNESDFSKVQPLKKGIGHTATTVSKIVDEGVAIVPVGFWFTNSDAKMQKSYSNILTPNVVVGMPIDIVETMSPLDVINVLHPAMQNCVDEAKATG